MQPLFSSYISIQKRIAFSSERFFKRERRSLLKPISTIDGQFFVRVEEELDGLVEPRHILGRRCLSSDNQRNSMAGRSRNFELTRRHVSAVALECLKETRLADLDYRHIAERSGCSKTIAHRYAPKSELIDALLGDEAAQRLASLCAASDVGDLAVWAERRLKLLRTEAGRLAGIRESEVRLDAHRYQLAFARLEKLWADMQDELCRRGATRAGAFAYLCALSGLEDRALYSNTPLEELEAASRVALAIAFEM
jgi:AcrR family transcriptional regulator